MFPSQHDILKAVIFKTSRSGGKGGQNVNKVSSKVELIFNYTEAECFTDEEKLRLVENLKNRLDGVGLLHVVAQEDRSQLLNKQRAIFKLMLLLKSASFIPKVRKATKVPKGVKEKRLTNKSQQAAKKQGRKRPGLD